MGVYYETQATGTDVDVDADHYVYVKKLQSESYWDTFDQMFKNFDDLVDGKIDLNELHEQHGLWNVTIDMGSYTGGITVIPRDKRDDVISGTIRKYYLIDGEPGVTIEREKRELHENYGGMDNLRYEDEDGNAIEGASIRVYTETQFDNNNLDHPIGITMTDEKGHWVNPIPVNTGNTYVVVAHKEGEYGPDNIELTVY